MNTGNRPLDALWVVGLALLSAVVSADARTWHVSPDGSGDAPTIQAGIDSAAAGDTVMAACGTYFEHDIAMKSAVCLRDKASRCATIDAREEGRAIVADHVTGGASIEGLVIRGGYAGGDWESSRGGGILVDHESAITIRDCLFRENWAEFGGGAFSDAHSCTVVEDCDFESNDAAHWGGGFVAYNDSTFVRDCRFTGNTARHGGALDCSWGTGGISDCSFRGNTGLSGGGAYLYTYSGEISRCAFIGNTATQYDGGGLRVGPFSTGTIVECVVATNRAAGSGGGIYFERHSAPRVIGCTIVGNDAPERGGGVLSFNAEVEIERSVVAFNTGAPGVECRYDGLPASVDLVCSDVYGNPGGDWVGCIADQLGVDGNFSADPLFCGAPTGDYSVASNSPCLPGHHPDGSECGLIGALGEGCGATAVEHTSWGGVKRMFR